MITEPADFNAYGLTSNISHISIVSCLTGIFLKSTFIPVPAVCDISHNAPNTPPSPISCIFTAP